MTKQKFQTLLENLDSEEERSRIILGLIERSQHNVPQQLLEGVLPEKQTSEAIEYLVGNENYRDAGTISEAAGNKGLAAKLFEKAGKYRVSGFLYKELGDLGNAVRLFEKAGDFGRAGETYEKLGNLEKALEAYARGDLLPFDFGRLRKLLGKIERERAIQILEENGWLITAAELCEKSGKLEKAVILYKEELSKRKQRPDDSHDSYNFCEDAGKLAEKIGLIEDAVGFYEKYNGFGFCPVREHAVKLARKHGLGERAFEIAVNNERIGEAVKIAVEFGFPERADELIERYKGKWHLSGIADLFNLRGDYEKAIEFYERDGQFGNAVRVAKESGNERRANLNNKLSEIFYGLLNSRYDKIPA